MAAPAACSLARASSAASRTLTHTTSTSTVLYSGVMRATRNTATMCTELSQDKKKGVIDLTGSSPEAANEKKKKMKKKMTTMMKHQAETERLGGREQANALMSPSKTQKRRRRGNSGSDGGSVRMLTWNVWFGPLAMEQRMVSIGATVTQLAPDVVAFQEMTATSHALLKSQPWWGRYEEFISPDRNPMYYEVLLVKKQEDSHIRRRRREDNMTNDDDPSSSAASSIAPSASSSASSSSSRLRTAEFASCQLRSRMGRNLLLARELTIDGCSFTVGTAHLESPCPDERGVFQLHSRERRHQMKQAISSIGARIQRDRGARAQAISSSSSLPDGGGGAPHFYVFMGDMNWDEKIDGPIVTDTSSGWIDAWTALRREDEPGFTYDAKVNGNLSGGLRRRLDRILVNCCGNNDVVTLSSIEMVGCEPVEPALHYEKRVGKKTKVQRVFASDHFGLLLTLNVRDISHRGGNVPPMSEASPPPGTDIHEVF